MACEYFLIEKPACPCCERPYEPTNMGIAAIGWAFIFRRYEDRGLTSAKAWFELMKQPGVVIQDQYDRVVPVEDFLALVEGKKALEVALSHNIQDEDGYVIEKRNRDGVRWND